LYGLFKKAVGFRFSIDAVLLAHFATVKKKDRIIDLGTGTGVIPLLLSTRANHLDILGVEIQKDLAEMAQRSVLLNNLTNIKILQADLRELDKSFNNQFNLIVSNPPYFPLNKGKTNPDPQVAISRHEIKCTLAELIKTVSRLLNYYGRFAFIHRAERLTEIFNQLQKYRLEPRRLRLIYPKIDNEANLVLIEAVKEARPSLTIEKPLIIYQEDGNYTREILDYYAGGET